MCGNMDDYARNHAAFWDGRMLSLPPICPQGELATRRPRRC
ncbi:hypothetical protein L1071_01305 [Chromohalobacter sarecensis]|nr:hypothetical protein [Chromohalobacter sarecensis]